MFAKLHDKKKLVKPAPVKRPSIAGVQDNIQVAVRVRPLSSDEISKSRDSILELVTDDKTKLGIRNTNDGKTSGFKFHHVFTNEQQEDVYSTLGRPLVENTLKGYNSCILAYGQTGSGKTHTMMGNHLDLNMRGIIPRLIEELMGASRVGQHVIDNETILTEIEVSYLEIYNENIFDLINPSDQNLKLREHTEAGIYVEGLTRVSVVDPMECIRILDKGNKQRTTAATLMNDRSSRSHAVFSIYWTKINVKTSKRLSAKVQLVDLAGSERLAASGVTGINRTEAVAINSSLTVLGKVIGELVKQPGKHISFRESKLTWLLSENFGGNSKTIMIACVSPVDLSYNETLSTLRYASAAQFIVNSIKVNETNGDKITSALKSEIEMLRKKVAAAGDDEVEKIREEVRIKESLLVQLTQSYEEKIKAKDILMNTLIEQIKAEYTYKMAQMQSQSQSELDKVMDEKDRIMHDLEKERSDNQKRFDDKFLDLHFTVHEKFENKVEDAIEKRIKKEVERLERIYASKVEERAELIKQEYQSKMLADDHVRDEMEQLHGQILDQQSRIRDLEKREHAYMEQNRALLADKVELKNKLDKFESVDVQTNLRAQLRAEMIDLINEKEEQNLSLTQAIAKLKDEHSLEIMQMMQIHQEKLEQLDSHFKQARLNGLKGLADSLKAASAKAAPKPR
jgi:hypothetical protein